ncbi:uncharacterized protein LOC111086618 isoform X2 [Limulus polyphemus]|uniref:Uncharacterized protein LOC111086618 isoform X2 n=1 Tax=Limulus polyphemus TaxID=6850 RepID=A0ABM1SQI1_LIMPO|nr:uncharacterized protein LOC111086618 isoform X2 [Limulus polyphemus]
MGNETSQEQGGEPTAREPSGQAFPGRSQEQTQSGLGFSSVGGLSASQQSQAQESKFRTLGSTPDQGKMTPTLPVQVPAAPQLDLSDLSEEEKSKILSVMAKAEHMDKDLEIHRQKVQHTRQEHNLGTTSTPPTGLPQHQQLCPQCHVTVLTAETTSQCADCKIAVCRKCGTSLAEGEGRAVWVCVECIRRRSQMSTSQPRRQPDREIAYQNQYLAPPGSRKQQQGYKEEASGEDLQNQDGRRLHSKSRTSRIGQAQQADSKRGEHSGESRMQRNDSHISVSQDAQNYRTIKKQFSHDAVDQPPLPWAPVSVTTHSSDQQKSYQPPLPWAPITTAPSHQMRLQQTFESSHKGSPLQHSSSADVEPMLYSNTQYSISNRSHVTTSEGASGQSSFFSSEKMASYSSMTQDIPQQQQKQQQALSYQSPKSSINELQNQKKQKQRSDSQEWSPMMDLSPIVDVSPSLEAAEQELMEKYQDYIPPMSMPRVTSGTIPEMLENFQRSVQQTPEDPQLKMQHFSSLDARHLSATSTEVAKAGKVIPMTIVNQPSRTTERTRPMPKEQVAPFSTVQIASTSQSQSSKASSIRRVHRRLPQPTLEQMQEAIALAAQTPKFKLSHNRGQTGSPQTPKGLVSSAEGKNVSRQKLMDKSPVVQQQHQSFAHSEIEQRGEMMKRTAADSDKSVLRSQTSGLNVSTASAFGLQSYGETHSLTLPSTTTYQSTSLPYDSGLQAMSSTLGMMYGSSQPLLMASSQIYPLGPERDILNTRGLETTSLSYSRSSSVPDSVSKIGVHSLGTRDKTGDSSDAQSDTGSTMSAKLRHTFPYMSSSQEIPSAAVVPHRKDRKRNLSVGSNPIVIEERTQYRPFPQRASSLEERGPISVGSNVVGANSLSYVPIYSSTEAYLGRRADSLSEYYMPKTDYYSRSAPGEPSRTIASDFLPRTMRQPSELGVARETLPSYMYSLKQRLWDEIKTVTDERRRLADLRHKSETDITSLLPPTDYLNEPNRKALYSEGKRIRIRSGPVRTISTSAQTSPQDTDREFFYIHPSAHTMEKRNIHFAKGYRDFSDDLTRYVLVPSKTFESSHEKKLSDDLPRPSLYPETFRGLARQTGFHAQDNPRDILALRLRETAISDNIRDQTALLNRYKRGRTRHPRYSGDSFSDTGAGWNSPEMSRGYSYFYESRKKRQDPQIRKPRSWHPSPYGSDDEEDILTRDEISRIKGEPVGSLPYAEDTDRLRKELRKLARKRETYERTSCNASYPGERMMPSRRRVRDARNNLGYLYSHNSDMYHTGPTWTKHDTGSSKITRSGDYFNATVPASYSNPSLSRYGYVRQPDVLYYGSEPTSPLARFQESTVEDKSMSRGLLTIPTTTATPYKTRRQNRLQIESILDFSPATTDSETPPDHSENTSAPPGIDYCSQNLLEDFNSTNIVARRSHQSQRNISNSDRSRGRPRDGTAREEEYREEKVQEKKPHKWGCTYSFPVKRILLTRDPKDRFVKGNGFGLEIVGGKELSNNSNLTGAYIAKIYPGVMASILNEVAVGDQVIEWNGINLNGKTYEEVKRIVASSGDEVEMIIRSDLNVLKQQEVSHVQRHSSSDGLGRYDDPCTGHNPRDYGSTGQDYGRLSLEQDYFRGNNGSRSGWKHNNAENPTSSHLPNPQINGFDRLTSSVIEPNAENQVDFADVDTEDIPLLTHHQSEATNQSCHSVLPLSTSSYQGPPAAVPVSRAFNQNCSKMSPTDDEQYKLQAQHITGEIKIQVCFDSKAAILYVTVVKARNLGTSRDNSGFPDPFVKCYLLPGRCIENQRRTRYFSRCSNPEWNQTMVYPNVTMGMLQEKFLEISVWNYDIHKPSEFLGEIILNLANECIIDEQARWYKLQKHDKSRYPRDPSGKTRGSHEGDREDHKMARLNHANGDIKFHFEHEKKFNKHYHRKSDRTKASEWPEP